MSVAPILPTHEYVHGVWI